MSGRRVSVAGRRRLVTLALLLTPALALLSLLFSSSTGYAPPQLEKDVLERVSMLSDQIDHLKLLDQEKNKAFRELRDQLLLLLKSASSDKALVPPTLRHLEGNQSTGNVSALLPLLSQSARTGIILNLSTAQLDMGVPSLYNFLPHLVRAPNGLTPALRIAAANRRRLHTVIGIPTVRRPKTSYLLSTLRSLFDNLEPEEREEILVVVMLASEAGLDDWASEQILAIQAEFPDHLAAALLEIIVPPPAFFPPDLERIPSTFEDSADRMKWRTKQNLDYAYLMMYCQNRARFYLQLEDDVITKPAYFAAIKAFITKQSEVSWLLLEFSSLGFIGKLFRSSDLPSLIQFILMFHREKPVDWLLDHLFYVRFCSPEKAPKVCQQTKNKYRIRYKPSLFQHVGVQSSLKGKVQKLKEKDFGKSLMHRPHADNPPANLSTSLKVYQAGDWLRLDLRPPVPIAAVHLRSGNAEHPDDRLYNASLHALYADKAEWVREAGVGPSGAVVAALSRPSVPLRSLKILLESESANWLILSEIWLRHNKGSPPAA